MSVVAGTVKFTDAEYRKFCRLLKATGAGGFDNYKRNIARLDLQKFMEEHGREKCDAMHRKYSRK